MPMKFPLMLFFFVLLPDRLIPHPPLASTIESFVHDACSVVDKRAQSPVVEGDTVVTQAPSDLNAEGVPQGQQAFTAAPAPIAARA